MDIPGLQEMRMTQQGELASGILRMKYDATIEMFGPSFFKPGDIVIINPVFLTKEVSTSAASVRLANEIGLGGVYMVLKSNTDITRDGVRTTLETVFQSYGTAFASKVQKIRDIRLKTR